MGRWVRGSLRDRFHVHSNWASGNRMVHSRRKVLQYAEHPFTVRHMHTMRAKSTISHTKRPEIPHKTSIQLNTRAPKPSQLPCSEPPPH